MFFFSPQSGVWFMHFEGEFHSAVLRHQEAAFKDSCIVGPAAVDVCVHVSVLSGGFTKSSASSVRKERCKKQFAITGDRNSGCDCHLGKRGEARSSTLLL